MSADNVVDFHPPLTKLKTVPNPHDPEGGYLCNIATTIKIAKDAGTPQGDLFYRTYVAEWHALNGQPLSHAAREERAFRSTAAKCGWTFEGLK